MENAGNAHRFAFEPFLFDGTTGELRGPHRSVKLRPQASQALELLLSRRGEVVSRDELRKALWPDERVVLFEGSIAAVIRELRRALGDDSKAPRFIETVPKRGYRFVGAGTEPGDSPVTEAMSAPGRRAVPKNARRGGLLRASGGLALAMMVLPIGSATSPPPDLQATAASNVVTVAVLPFENLTGLPVHEILAESLPRDLVGWLGGVMPERLRVVDRIGTEKARDLAPEEQSADFVILGSVGADGDATAISARMLSGGDRSFVWGERYRRGTDDTGLTAREVAARIADSVMSKSLPRWRNGSAADSADPAAADAFRRGTAALAQLTPEGMSQAEAAFTEAIELDSGFSAAHAHLAETLIHWIGSPMTNERIERARRAAQVAIELVETNATGYRVLGEIGLYYDRDWESAGQYLERSIELSPSDASGHHSYATWLSARGRHDDALREVDLGAALDPGSVSISIDVMFLRYYARDFEGAVTAARRLERLWPGYYSPHRTVVLSQLAMGNVAAAADEARTVLARHPEATDGRSAADLPDSDALEAYWTALRNAFTRHLAENPGDSTILAVVDVQLGRLDEANEALESALASGRFSYFLPYLGVSPSFDRMCGHPGFERILRRLQQATLSSETRLPRCAAAMGL